MITVYRFLINLIFIISPIIFVFRLLKKKEDPIRFKEKLGFFSKKKEVVILYGFMEQVLGNY